MNWKFWMFGCSILALFVGMVFVGKACSSSDEDTRGAAVQARNDASATTGSRTDRTDGSTKEAEEAAARERRLASLVAAGIDPTSTQALIEALNHKDNGVQYAAIYLLGQKGERTAIPSLKKLLNAPSSYLRLSVCEALSKLKDDSWKMVCIGLLKDSDLLIALRAAELLAENGIPLGWEIVRQNLLNSKSVYVFEAARIAPSFDGLEIKTKVGKTNIDVLAEILPIFEKSDEATQTTLLGVIAKVADAQDTPQLKKMLTFVKSKKSTYNRDSLLTLIKKIGAYSSEDITITRNHK